MKKLYVQIFVMGFLLLLTGNIQANDSNSMSNRIETISSYPPYDNLELNIHRLRYDKRHQIAFENSTLFSELINNGISNKNLRGTYITPINISLPKNEIENIVFIADGQQQPGLITNDNPSALSGHTMWFKKQYTGKSYGETHSFIAKSNSLYSKLRKTNWFPIDKTYWFHADDHQYNWARKTSQKKAIRKSYTKQICSKVGSNTKRIYMAGASRGGALILEIAKKIQHDPQRYGCPDMENIHLYVQSFDSVFNTEGLRGEFGAQRRDVSNPLIMNGKKYQAHLLNISEQFVNKKNLKIWHDVSGERISFSVHAFTHNSYACQHDVYCSLDESENPKWYQQVWGTYPHFYYTESPRNNILNPALDVLKGWLDEETGTSEGWTPYDSTPSGATISSIIDEDKGKVVQFSGAGTENGYMLGDWSGGANVWNNTTEKTITWSMKYNEDFRVYISVETEDGHRFIEYSNTRNDSSSEWSNGEYIHHGLGESVTDGTWQTFTRDLEGDLKDFERDNSIVSVNAFMIRGSGVLDDIKLLPKRIYEHAEDINTKGWMVYDNSPSGASISNIEDNGNRVIQLQGAGRKNGYILGDWIGGANVWNNTTEKIITWRMKYDEDFVVYVSVETEKGQKYLYYTNSDGNKGQSKNYIHHGIGENASDGTWQTFTRDLEADLQDLESDNSITSVNAFLIRGSGLVDDIELLNDSTIIGSLELNNAHGIVFSKDEKVAYVATYNNALQLIDISNPNSPKLLDRFSMPGVPLYITGLSDSEILVYSLLGSATYKLYKVDISDPLDLTITDVKLVSQKDIPQYNPNFEVLANLANIDYLNIENPKNIVLSNDGSLVYVIKSKRLFILRLK